MKSKILLLVLLGLIITSSKAYSQSFISKNIRGKGGISQQLTKIDENKSIAFNVSQAKSLLDLNQNSELVLKKTMQDKLGFIHYRFYQTYKGVPIENTMYIIHTKNGLLKSLGGAIILDFDTQMDNRSIQRISNTQAIDIAVKYVGAKLYAWLDAAMEKSIKQQTNNLNATYKPKADLVWYSATNTINPRELRLCYKVNVYAIQPFSSAYYFVDVITGNVLGKKDRIFTSDATGTANTYYSGAQTIHSDLTGGSYKLRDYTKGGGIITLHGENASRGNNYTSTSANWTLSGANKAALDAHYGVSQTYAFYFSNFGRNSFDDAGSALISYVNDPTYVDNAFWDQATNTMNFNKRSDGVAGGVTGIDVTGHELTHGVTQETSELDYNDEPGAMNESMSDIMGKSVQFWSKPTDIDWTLSNDMDWIIRDMSNPNAEGQPDTYHGTHWYFGTGDHGGVHTNSGVGNFMFYLLVTGGSGTNDNGDAYTVSGIGLAKADQILYRTNTNYLTITSQYSDWRDDCISAAEDLYGANSNEVAQVKNAFHAVGIGSADGECADPAGLTASAITTTSATVSWDATGAAKYNLRYKPSTSSTWTVVNNLTSTSYNLTGLTSSTKYSYKVQANCGGGFKSSFSKPGLFITPYAGGPAYCTTTGNTDYEYIDSVRIGNIKYQSGDNGGYGNFTGLAANLTAGNPITIKLKPGFQATSYTEYWTVFIDYNHNGVFTDAGEEVVQKNSTSIVSQTFTVSSTALNGLTRIRIIMHYGSYRNQPCGSFADGEAEDYMVNITSGAFTADASVNADKANSLNSILVTPNPVKNSTANLVLQVNKAEPVNIKITDLSGRILKSETINGIVVGKNNYPLHNLSILPGTYMIFAEQSGSIIARAQFIVAK